VPLLSDQIYPTLIDIHKKLDKILLLFTHGQCNSLLIPVKETENVGPDLECLIANDIDCFFGNAEDGPFAMEGVPQKQMINGNEVNFVKVCHFNIDGLLDNNDFNATAFTIGVSKTNGRCHLNSKLANILEMHGSSCQITFSVLYDQDKPRQEHMFDLHSNRLR
jgi:hypothetical protein